MRLDQGQAGALFEKRSHLANDCLSQADLLVQLSKDIFARDWGNVAENYLSGKLLIYAEVEAISPNGENDLFRVIIGQRDLMIGGIGLDIVDCGNPSTATHNAERRRDGGVGFHQANPVLILVGDFVDGPKGVIPSGVWFLGKNEVPLISGEFLFHTVWPNHTRGWEYIRLPGVAVNPAEWKPYARCSSAIELNERNCRLVEGCSAPSGNLYDVEGEALWNGCAQVADYVKCIGLEVLSRGVNHRTMELIDGRHKLSKLALSTFDVFL